MNPEKLSMWQIFVKSGHTGIHVLLDPVHETSFKKEYCGAPFYLYFHCVTLISTTLTAITLSYFRLIHFKAHTIIILRVPLSREVALRRTCVAST